MFKTSLDFAITLSLLLLCLSLFASFHKCVFWVLRWTEGKGSSKRPMKKFSRANMQSVYEQTVRRGRPSKRYCRCLLISLKWYACLLGVKSLIWWRQQLNKKQNLISSLKFIIQLWHYPLPPTPPIFFCTSHSWRNGSLHLGFSSS